MVGHSPFLSLGLASKMGVSCIFSTAFVSVELKHPVLSSVPVDKTSSLGTQMRRHSTVGS